MNGYFEQQPTITISPPPEIIITPDEKIHYFNDKDIIVDNELLFNDRITNNDKNINISNKINPHHHPWVDQKIKSEPILNLLTPQPQSILLKNHINSSPAIPKHITLKEDEERRPSVITFVTEYYDAIEDTDDKSPTIKKKQINNQWRRPSLISRISSAYTNKTAAITVDHIDLNEFKYLHEGIVICAIVSKRKQQMKRALKWKEYKAVITQSGYLELYNVCHCNSNQQLHIFCHTKRPQHKIDLSSTVTNNFFKKSFHHNNDCYTLSLMSPIDFSWSLSSLNTIYYFQSKSIQMSQNWYQSLYTILPLKSKLSLPRYVDLEIPELSTCIRLPISELITEQDENVELRKVLDSSLVLLHRNGNRPSHWNKKTIGLCWKLLNSTNDIDWALKPSDDEDHVAYLIEPRLIEKTHELQLRYWNSDENKGDTIPPTMQGYLIEQSSNSSFYANTIDQFIFLFEYKPQNASSNSCFSIFKNGSNNKTSPNMVESSQARDAIGVIDLFKITEELSFDHTLLQLNEYSFLPTNHTVHDWSTRLDTIQKYYLNNSSNNSIKQWNDIYIKSSSKRRSFKRRFCIITDTGELCVFKSSTKNSIYKKMDFSIPLKEEIYLYSGEECCNYISRLPIQSSSRIFDNGQIVEKSKPNQCCFVIHYKNQDYVFLLKSPKEKEAWVQTICKYMKPYK